MNGVGFHQFVYKLFGRDRDLLPNATTKFRFL